VSAFSIAAADTATDSDFDGLIDSWEQTHFGNITSHSGRDDPDNDSLILLMEMAMDLSPHDFDPQPELSLIHQGENNFLGLEYSESKTAPNVTIFIEESAALDTWDSYEVDDDTRTIDIIDADPDGDGSRVRKKFLLKLGHDGKRFVRLTAQVHALAPLSIDDFSADQAPAFENPSSDPDDTESYLKHPSILGGERDLEVLAEPGSISAGVSGGTLNVSFGAKSSGQVTFVWDGMDGTSIDPLLIGDRTRGDMIGPIDAEIAGFNAIRMMFSEASTEFPLSVTLSTSAGSSHYTDASATTPFRVPQGGGEVVVPFSEIKFPTYNSPDFADIRAVRVNLRYLGTKNPATNNFKLDQIEFLHIDVNALGLIEVGLDARLAAAGMKLEIKQEDISHKFSYKLYCSKKND